MDEEEILDRPEETAAVELFKAEAALDDKKLDGAVRHLTRAVEILLGKPPKKGLPSQAAEEVIDLLSRVSLLGDRHPRSEITILEHELLDVATALRRSATRAALVPADSARRRRSTRSRAGTRP